MANAFFGFNVTKNYFQKTKFLLNEVILWKRSIDMQTLFAGGVVVVVAVHVAVAVVVVIVVDVVVAVAIIGLAKVEAIRMLVDEDTLAQTFVVVNELIFEMLFISFSLTAHCRRSYLMIFLQ